MADAAGSSTAKAGDNRNFTLCCICNETFDRLQAHFDGKHKTSLKKRLRQEKYAEIDAQLAPLTAAERRKQEPRLRAEAEKEVTAAVELRRAEVVKYGNALKKTNLTRQTTTVTEIRTMLGPFSGALRRVQDFLISKGLHVVDDTNAEEHFLPQSAAFEPPGDPLASDPAYGLEVDEEVFSQEVQVGQLQIASIAVTVSDAMQIPNGKINRRARSAVANDDRRVAAKDRRLTSQQFATERSARNECTNGDATPKSSCRKRPLRSVPASDRFRLTEQNFRCGALTVLEPGIGAIEAMTEVQIPNAAAAQRQHPCVTFTPSTQQMPRVPSGLIVVQSPTHETIRVGVAGRNSPQPGIMQQNHAQAGTPVSPLSVVINSPTCSRSPVLYEQPQHRPSYPLGYSEQAVSSSALSQRFKLAGVQPSSSTQSANEVAPRSQNISSSASPVVTASNFGHCGQPLHIQTQHPAADLSGFSSAHGWLHERGIAGSPGDFYGDVAPSTDSAIPGVPIQCDTQTLAGAADCSETRRNCTAPTAVECSLAPVQLCSQERENTAQATDALTVSLAFIAPQETRNRTSPLDCIRLCGVPPAAQLHHILDYLGEFSAQVASLGIHMTPLAGGNASREALFQMNSEPLATICAAELHSKPLHIGEKEFYVDVRQCSCDATRLHFAGADFLPACVLSSIASSKALSSQYSRAASASTRTGQFSSSMHRSLQSVSESTQQSFDNHVHAAALASFGLEAANAHPANIAQCEPDAGYSVIDEALSLRLRITQHPLLLEFYEHLREERPSVKAETQASQTVACVARTLYKHYAMNGLEPSTHELSVDYVVQSGTALKSFCDDFYAISRNAWSTRNFVTSYRRFVNFLMARRIEHRIMLEALKATIESLERQYQRLAYARQNKCLSERFKRTSGKTDYAALISILDSARVGAAIAAIAEVIRGSPESLSRSQYADFSYYLQCAVVFRNAQRPEIVRTLTVKEFLEATAQQPVNGLFVIEIADNKNAPKVTRVVVPEGDFNLMHLYFRKLRPLHTKSSDQDEPCANDVFFINKNGRRFVNTGVTLQRWLRGRGVENAAPNKVRRAAATRVAENFPLGSKTSRSAAILMGHSERTRNRHYLDHPAESSQAALSGYSALKALVSASRLPAQIKTGVFFTEEFKRRLFELYPASLTGRAPSFSESQLCPVEISDRPSFMRSIRDLWRNERKKLYASQKPSAHPDDHSCNSDPDMIPGTPRAKTVPAPRRNLISKRVSLRQPGSREAGLASEIDPSILLPLPLDVDEYLRRSNFRPWQDFPWVRVVDLAGGQGKGVIVLCRLAQGQLIFDYKGTRISKRQHEQDFKYMDESTQRIVESYRLLLPADECYVLSHDDAYLGISSFGRLCNHSRLHANIYPASRVLQRSDGYSCNAILFYAKRNIAENEELTWDYGPDFRNAVWYNECHCKLCGGRCNCTSCKGLSRHPRPSDQACSSAAEPAELRLNSLQVEGSDLVHSSQITPPSNFGLSGYLAVFGKRNHLFLRKTNRPSNMSLCALLHQQLLGSDHQMTPESIQHALSSYQQNSDGSQSSFAGVFQLLAANRIPSVLLFHASETADAKGVSIRCEGQAASCIMGLYYLAESSQWSIIVPPFAHDAARLRKPATAKSFVWQITDHTPDQQTRAALAELRQWCISKIPQPNQKNKRLSALTSSHALNEQHSMHPHQQQHDLASPSAHNSSASRANLKRNAGPYIVSPPVPAKGSRGKR